MKIKAIFSFIILSFCVCLSSCTVTGYSEPEDRYIVSAMGFDRVDGAIEVSVQIVGEGEYPFVRYGRGESVGGAVGHIEGADAKQLEISHCALIVLGDGLSAEDRSEIFDYCRKSKDITVGVKMAAAHNASELMETADGYLLLGAIRDGSDGLGFTGGCRFYEIEEKRMEGGVYHLPYFSVDGDTYSVSGLRLYRGDVGLVSLDRSESAYYMMIRGELSGGALDVEIDGKQTSLYVIKSKTERSEKEGDLYLTVTLDVKGEDDGAASAIKSSAERLCGQLTDRYGSLFGEYNDIFFEIRLEVR